MEKKNSSLDYSINEIYSKFQDKTNLETKKFFICKNKLLQAAVIYLKTISNINSINSKIVDPLSADETESYLSITDNTEKYFYTKYFSCLLSFHNLYFLYFH